VLKQHLKYIVTRCRLSNELWFDVVHNDEYFYHIISIQLREKDDMVAIQFIFLGFAFIFFYLPLSDLLLKQTKKIKKDNKDDRLVIKVP